MNQNLSEQFQQLPMFMSVSEIQALRPNDFVSKGVYDSAPEDAGRQARAGWRRKLDEATWRSGRPQSLRQVVAEKGIERPVIVGHGTDDDYLRDGHHRIAVAAEDRGPDYLVPVIHTALGETVDKKRYLSGRSR